MNWEQINKKLYFKNIDKLIGKGIDDIIDQNVLFSDQIHHSTLPFNLK